MFPNYSRATSGKIFIPTINHCVRLTHRPYGGEASAVSPNLLILRNRGQLIHTPPLQVGPGPGQRETSGAQEECCTQQLTCSQTPGAPSRTVINDGGLDELTETGEHFEEEERRGLI